MIPRYSRPEMANVWSEATKYQIWLDVELAALEAMADEGLVPAGIAAEIRARAVINPERVQEIEDEVKHDVIAFLTSIAEVAGPNARFMHRGMTSSDLLDTAFAIQLTRSAAIIDRGLVALLDILKERAHEFKLLPTIGRSHGIHAEPTTFGLKLASFYAEVVRRRTHLQAATREIATGKIAGAVGTYASVPPSVEAKVMAAFGLSAETVPSQIVHRDRHAAFFSSLALLGSSLERIVVEVRHLQRTEVREVEEGFGKGQKGSSAMPHKKNPILSENVSGLARLLRGYSVSALENVALWHERDISHSSVERMIAPDACVIADFAVARVSSLLRGLVVHGEQMARNLALTGGLVFSGTLLIRLTDKGMAREAAYAVVQRHALSSWSAVGGAESDAFRRAVGADPAVTELMSKAEIDEVFSLDRHLKSVDAIFARTFDQE